jgi:aspartyl/asparaginyl beta-hydroxylase (cupin superfamily)
MSAPSIDPSKLRQAGLYALQSGDSATARHHFEQIAAAGVADASIWGALAMACQNLGDMPAMVKAVDRALALDQGNLPALIMKGDYLLAAGNARAATSFYGLAVALAARRSGLSQSTMHLVRRAEAVRERINADIERHLRACLAEHGYDQTRSSARFTHSLDVLTGRKQRYSQRPRAYFYPELPEIQFYPRAQFPWLDAVEAATDDICMELTEVLKRKDAFVPYIQKSADGPANDGHRLLNSLDWSAFFLWKDGAPVGENAAQCPKTLAALEDAPLVRIEGRTPSILFSLLKPGAHIAPHTGFLNCRLICHLPLIAPPGCRLRVGNDEREWRQGKAWVFDDTIEHEARNSSDQTRVVLIFDVWRPELTDEERGLVAVLMRSVDTYGGDRPSTWDD